MVDLFQENLGGDIKKKKILSASCHQPHGDVVIKTGSGIKHQLAVWLKITAVIMQTFASPNMILKLEKKNLLNAL